MFCLVAMDCICTVAVILFFFLIVMTLSKMQVKLLKTLSRNVTMKASKTIMSHII